MTMWEKLYSKNGLTAKNIAKELLDVEIGEKIPRVADYSEKLSIGRGTVQIALGLLEELKAIRLEARGHLGTFLIDKDIELLQEIAGISPLIGTMPLPYSRKYEGLATGMVEAFENAGKKINLSYMRGGLNRIEAVRTKRSDFAIVSKLTANNSLEKYPGLQVMKRLGANSYVSAHKVFLADSEEDSIRNGMRIGVDMDSPDQKELTFSEFKGMDVEYVYFNYMQLFDMLQTKQIDAAVWSMDDKRLKQMFTFVDFKSEEARKTSKDTSEAVIVIDGARKEEIVDKWGTVANEDILSIQNQVEEGTKIPRY
ncbi:GntR family transcriptional regulator YhfZ [Ornithinibacillus bavariensis]|uniref:Transcriptional regulator n=1 Tax=Ornithinibacillus bavariensis TaxID=545502 RepID=A0A920C799_9BACI|nr:GntR family transcriptional regulator YhfZ [Ornithinibacillus bavariensis]GIO26949.1 transcriptional regulator [Ornithinibacillus bavariensis]